MRNNGRSIPTTLISNILPFPKTNNFNNCNTLRLCFIVIKKTFGNVKGREMAGPDDLNWNIMFSSIRCHGKLEQHVG